MNSCRSYRQLLALHAASALDHRECEVAQSHLARCAGCREYFETLNSIVAAHEQAANALPRVEPAANFYQQTSRNIGSGNIRKRPSGNFVSKLLAPRWAWVAAGIAVGGIIVLLNFNTKPKPAILVNLPQLSPPLAPSASSFISYRLALNHSFDELDEQLSKAATPKNASSPPARHSREALADPGI